MESEQNNQSNATGVDRLLDMALRGQYDMLSESEFAELEQLLKSDPELLDRYIKHVGDSLSIGQIVLSGPDGDDASEVPSVEPPKLMPEPAPRGGDDYRAKWRFALSILAASVATFFVSWLILADNNQPQPVTKTQPDSSVPTVPEAPLEYVATLTGAVDCQWANFSVSPKYGEPLEAGREITLLTGLAQLTFDDGAKVVLQGPATFKVEGTGSALLSAGKLSALVPRQAVGFRIQTPTAEVVDLGTEFGLEVDSDGKTEVHVFTGEVVIWNRENSKTTSTGQHLEQHEAALMEAGQEHSLNLEYDDSKFGFRQFSPQLSAEELPPLAVTRDLALWLAADVLLKTDDSGKVIAWRDIATGDNQTEEDAWQHDPLHRPEYIRKSLGGLPAVRFDGETSFLTTTPLVSTEDQTLFLVFARDDQPAKRPQLRQLINYNGPPYPLDFGQSLRVLQIGDQNEDGKYWARYFAGVGEDKFIYNVGSIATERAVGPWDPVLLAYRYDAANNQAQLWLNGHLQGTDTAPRWKSYTSRKVIGRHPRQGFFGGDISEVLIFNGSLNDAEVLEVTDYLMTKYLLTK